MVQHHPQVNDISSDELMEKLIHELVVMAQYDHLMVITHLQQLSIQHHLILVSERVCIKKMDKYVVLSVDRLIVIVLEVMIRSPID